MNYNFNCSYIDIWLNRILFVGQYHISNAEMGRLSRRVQYYSENTTIHGIGHVTNASVHVLERLTWFIVVLISIYGMSAVFLASFGAYNSNPISFATETTYLNWNSTFPAVTLCQLVNLDIFSESKSKDNVYLNFISEIVFFTGACYSCSKKCPKCETTNFQELVSKYRKGCNQLLGKCYWNGKYFDCCEK